MIPRGGGTKLGWGNPPMRADVVLSTARLNRVVEHAWADLTVTVEAGCTIQNLQKTLAEHGQRLALDPLWPERATVGGILATNDSGALRLRFGALRDLIIGVTLALPDGTLAKSGGKVVKNVAGYDLPKLVTGALGTLGVITRAVFRLHPLPRDARTFTLRRAIWTTLNAFSSPFRIRRLAHSGLQLRDARERHPRWTFSSKPPKRVSRHRLEQLRSIGRPGAHEIGPASRSGKRGKSCMPGRAGSDCKIQRPASVRRRNVPRIGHLADSLNVLRSAVVQATGLGWLRLAGIERPCHSPVAARPAARTRTRWRFAGVLHHPAAMPAIDAWGSGGDALPLMRSVKQQFDPGAR